MTDSALSSNGDPLAFVRTSLSLIEHIKSLETELCLLLPSVLVNKRHCETLALRVLAVKERLEELEGRELRPALQSQDSQDSSFARPPSNNQIQLESMLGVVQQALALALLFGSDACFRGLWEKSDYSVDFALISEMLLDAADDLCLGLEAPDYADLFSRRRDAEDALADLEDISRQQHRILQQVEAELQAQADPAVMQPAEQQPSAAKLNKRLEAEISVARRKRDHVANAVAALAPASSSSAAFPPVPPVTAALQEIPMSDLHLGECVGGGAQGDVFQARLVSRDCEVAVKRLHVRTTPALIAAFHRELSMLHSLPRHKHIISLLGYAVDRPKRHYLMVMEWAHQGSLDDYLQSFRLSTDEGASLSMASRLRMCLQCASAVNHLHRLSPVIVHRDIKPHNFLVDEFNVIKLADFGLARIRAASTIVSSSAQVQQRPVGTTRWMAPEFLRPGGKKSSTTASDVYALAVVMWEILTLQIPYEGDDEPVIMRHIERGGTLDVESLPLKLQSLLQACWLNDPKQRPSCGDIILALKQIIAEEQQRPSVGSFAPQPSSAASAIAAVPLMVPSSELGSSELAGFEALDQRSDLQHQREAAALRVVAPAEAQADLPLAAVGAQAAGEHPSQASALRPDRMEPVVVSSMDAAPTQPSNVAPAVAAAVERAHDQPSVAPAPMAGPDAAAEPPVPAATVNPVDASSASVHPALQHLAPVLHAAVTDAIQAGDASLANLTRAVDEITSPTEIAQLTDRLRSMHQRVFGR